MRKRFAVIRIRCIEFSYDSAISTQSFVFLHVHRVHNSIRRIFSLESLVGPKLKRISDSRAYEAQNEVSGERFHIMRRTRIASRDERNVYIPKVVPECVKLDSRRFVLVV